MKVIADDPNDYYDIEKTAAALVVEFISKSHEKELKEFCDANDLDLSTNDNKPSEIKDLQKAVLSSIKDELLIIETAKSLSGDIISNLFLSSDVKEIDSFCKKFNLPQQLNKSLEGAERLEAQKSIRNILSCLQEDIDIYSAALSLGIKYLHPAPKDEKSPVKIKQTTWEDVGEYLSEKELASLIGVVSRIK